MQVDLDSHGREVEKYDRSKLRSWKKAKVAPLKEVQIMSDISIEKVFWKEDTTELPIKYQGGA